MNRKIELREGECVIRETELKQLRVAYDDLHNGLCNLAALQKPVQQLIDISFAFKELTNATRFLKTVEELSKVQSTEAAAEIQSKLKELESARANGSTHEICSLIGDIRKVGRANLVRLAVDASFYPVIEPVTEEPLYDGCVLEITEDNGSFVFEYRDCDCCGCKMTLDAEAAFNQLETIFNDNILPSDVEMVYDYETKEQT